jgi:hypothetical protein
VFNEYFKKILDICKRTDCQLRLNFHNHILDKYKNYINDFCAYINKVDPHKSNYLFQNDIYNIIENNNLLIINNLGCLAKENYDSGNIKKCFKNFPDLKSIHYLNTVYSFCNDGPDNSILDTANKICKEIDTVINDIDVVIISNGCYSLLLADHINKTTNNKQIVILGGDLQFYFGITTYRAKICTSTLINEHFISVPDELKPKNYLKIENGCYW